MKPLLQAKKISKAFDGNVIVKSTDFIIEKGSIHVIEGKSGSGKSTFLSILGGMEKPDQGEVRFNDHSLYRMVDKKQAGIRGKSFGYIFQSFHLIPELTVKENIELPLQFNLPGSRKSQVYEISKALGIEQHLEKKPGFLSGGEQQRVAVARALIMNPEIIFADEPTGNLDQDTTREIIELIVNLTIQFKVSLVVVTHEKNLISHPHHLYTMENGYLKEVPPSYV